MKREITECLDSNIKKKKKNNREDHKEGRWSGGKSTFSESRLIRGEEPLARTACSLRTTEHSSCTPEAT